MDRLRRWLWGMEIERRHPGKVVPPLDSYEVVVKLNPAIAVELWDIAAYYDRSPSEIAESLLVLSIKDAMEALAKSRAAEPKEEAAPAV